MKKKSKLKLDFPKQKHICSVHFLSSSIFIEKTKEDGSKVCFETEGEQIEQLFSGKNFSTGIMPLNTLYYGVVGNDEEVAIYLPAAKRTIKTVKQEYVVPMPAFVLYGFKKQYKIFALRKGHIGSYTTLYCAPLSNVHPGGEICQGTAKFPRCSKNTIEEAAALFFNATFNDDLSGGRTVERGNIYAFFRKIKDAKSFPESKLLPEGMTLNDLFKRSDHDN